MTDSNTRDTIFASPLEGVEAFQFDERVVDVFPDMIKRSVPGYGTTINMIGTLTERYATTGTNCYDLGCSLGAATLSMRHRIQAANVNIFAIDNSPAMVANCQQVIEADSGEVPVELLCQSIQETEINNASVIVLNFTLQFVPIDERRDVLRKIYEGLNPGGVLILSEKVAFQDKDHDDLMIELHHNFKEANGYSKLEVAQKRSALENVLMPETLEAHRERLRTAGFSSCDVWFQCFNFASMIAIK